MVSMTLPFIARSRRTPRRRAIGAYVDPSWFARHPLVGYSALALAGSYYGYQFGLYGAGNFPIFLMPLIVLGGLLFWVMPELANPPRQLMERVFIGLLFALLCWPDYIALTAPGLPWITALRIFGIPLMLLMAVCLFGSPAFRADTLDIMRGDRWIWRLMLGFMAIAAGSVVLSVDKSYSANRFLVGVMAWLTPFVVSCRYFAQSGKPRRFAYYMLFVTLYCLAIGVYEARHSILPWAGHIPSFLKVEDERIDALLAGTFRAASGVYRVQSKFTTSIGFGECMAMTFPFLIHLMMTTRNVTIRAVIVLMIPVMFYVVLRTDSRLAIIGFGLTLLLYVLVAAVLRWRRDGTSMFAPVIVMVYPVFMVALLFLSLVWKRFGNMIWGGGAAQFSTQSRQEQLHMGLPMILHNPIGHGIGEGASTLGYIAPGSDILTIDSYFLSLGLEVGVIGLLVFLCLFLRAIWTSANLALGSRDDDVLYVVPASIALFNFLVSKSIYSEVENHTLAFIILGMVVGLAYRDKQLRAAAAPSAEAGLSAKPSAVKKTGFRQPRYPGPDVAPSGS